MVKRILIALVVVFFLSAVTTPKLAFAEDSGGGNKAGLAALALIAIGVLVIASNSDRASLEDSDTFASNKPNIDLQSSREHDKGLDVGLDFTNSGYTADAFGDPMAESRDDWRSPELKVGFTW